MSVLTMMIDDDFDDFDNSHKKMISPKNISLIFIGLKTRYNFHLNHLLIPCVYDLQSFT